MPFKYAQPFIFLSPFLFAFRGGAEVGHDITRIVPTDGLVIVSIYFRFESRCRGLHLGSLLKQ
jgi:hypothetical protein